MRILWKNSTKPKFFLTGKPRSGKSTVLIKIIKLLKDRKLKVGGFVTPEIVENGKRIGFSVMDVYSGKKEILASVEFKTGPKLGKYRVSVENFERIALEALEFAVRECDVICIDEIGKMEFFSLKFKKKLLEILKSKKVTIAVLHRNFVNEFKNYGKIVEVTPKNRGNLPEKIVKELFSE
jgi:nucleoside-triphosphatase